MHWSKGRVVSVVIAAMFVAGIGLGMSCSKRSGDVNAIANPEYVKPIGHVFGKVVDLCTDESIKDVEVSIAIKGSIKKFTTKADGMFAFQNLPVNVGGGAECYLVVANFAKYNKKNAEAVEDWNEDNPTDLKVARPYPDTVETGEVCLSYEAEESASSSGAVTYTGSGAVTIVDGLAGGIKITASRPVGTVVGEAYWGKDKTPASGVVLNLYGPTTLEGQAVVQADGTYQFSMVHECLDYTIKPAKPCFEFVGTDTYAGAGIVVQATQLSNPDGDLALTNWPCIELSPIPCLDDIEPCLIASSPKEKEDITTARPTITLTFSELMDETLPVKETVEILYTGYKALLPPSVDFDFAWSTALVNMEGYPTTQTVSILTLTPTEDLMLGMKYDIKIGGGGNLLYTPQDLAGNEYDAGSSVCSVFEASLGNGLISFTTNYGGTCPKATDLAQLALTANAVNPAIAIAYMDKDAGLGGTQAPVLNTAYWNPAGGDTTTEYTANQAVISWTAPGTVTDPVRVKGYRLYARVNDMDPWTQVANETALNPYASYWPAKSVFATVNLTDINEALASGSIEQMADANWGYDKTGVAAQTLQLAVTTVNADGLECPQIDSDNSIILKDNTAPMIIRDLNFSTNALSWGSLSNAYFYDTGAGHLHDTVTLSSIVYPTSGAPTAWTQGLMACNYGDLPLAIPMLEDVDSATVSGVTFQDTSATAANGICQLTFCTGWYTEPNDATDGTLVQTLGPKLVASAGKNKIILVWNNAYKLDTGDRLIVPGVRDIAGNTSQDWVHVVDTIPPMIKSVKVNPTSDTLTVITTERVPAGDPDDGTNQANLVRFALNHFTNNNAGAPALSTAREDLAYGSTTVQDGICADGFCNGYSAVQGNDETTITIYLTDVSFIAPGDFIHFDNMEDDAWINSTRAPNTSTDPGTWAYWYGKPTEPGAYDPDGGTGLGTRANFSDQNYNTVGTTTPNANRQFGIPPRIHQSAPGLPAGAPYAPNASITLTSVDMTEDLYNPADVTPWAANDPNNPANWSVGIHDCGVDGVCNNADDPVAAVGCAVTGVATTTANRTFSVTCTVPNVAGHTYSFTAMGGSSISISNVLDARGTAISGHNTITYDANIAQWVRN